MPDGEVGTVTRMDRNEHGPDGGGTRRRDLLRAAGAATGAGLLGASGIGAGLAAGAPETHTFLCQNAWLLDGVVTDDSRYSPVAKPALDERARGLGRRLAGGDVDILGFQEVFAEEQREQINDRLEREFDEAIGPRGVPETAPKSSGLYTLGLADNRILASERMAYRNRGNPRRDADAYARKGVLFTRVAVGDGAIDLFTTHLLAGGGLPGYRERPLVEPESDEQYRRDQLQEFEAFVNEVKAEYDPDGAVPTVCAGDFNIAPGDSEYDALTSFRDGLGLYDVWDRFGDGYGGTNNDAITDGCVFDPEESPPSYCDGGSAGSRIDYIFVEQGHPGIRVEDIRRRVFWRRLAPPGQFFADEDEQVPNYLADHVALELEFAVPSGTRPEEQDGLLTELLQ
jgi:endonuclease/exonuclease/phosphatase family metal-dependent hydrolase